MTSEYTGFGGGYDADAYSGDQAMFEHQRRPTTTTQTTNNVRLTTQINRRTSNISNDKNATDSATDIDKQLASNKIKPGAIAKGILTGVTKSYDNARPLYVDHIPQELTDVANMIEDPDEFLRSNPEWDMLNNEFAEDQLGMKTYINDATKEIKLAFQGYDGRASDTDMVMKTIPNPLKDAAAEFKKSDKYSYTTKEIDDLMKEFPDHDVSFAGHSWGAYKARHFAGLYDKESQLLNAHIMPWNEFPKGGNHTFHTTISDPTDFKHIFPQKTTGESHFYYPASKIVDEEPMMQKALSGHYLKNFVNAGEVSSLSKYAAAINKTGVLHAAGLGMAAVDAGFTVKDDITNDNPIGQKISDSTIDVANKTQEFVVGGEVFSSVFAAGLAAAPETGGISLLAGAAAIGSVIVYTEVSEKLAPIVKKGVVKAANVTKDAVVDEANSISNKANSAFRSVKHFFHW
jgi:hypothetical protein